MGNTATMSGNDGAISFRDGAIRLQAAFSRSPLAIAGAFVVLIELSVSSICLSNDLRMPTEFLQPMNIVAATLLVAGLFPAFNCLSYSRDGIEQNIGLTCLKLKWDEIEEIVPSRDGVVIHYHRHAGGVNLPRHAVLENRYGIEEERLAAMLSAAWQREQHRRGGTEHRHRQGRF